MAQKTVVELIDDLDGSRAGESVTFALDGVEYTIDLSRENAAKLRDTLAEHIARGRRVGGQKRRAAGADQEPFQTMREWARSNGTQISSRGPIPAEVIAQFQAAHPR
ncbi:Lsr2 family protein [Kutzneria sp. NPDC052558]|uniref:Lsr2 family protein n=1 Tax=Kutzneria sp. NPDC052558 TaxID=3364121 RepID=UPI0037C7FA83